jgi:two-component system, sensor histidine kinase and response regulator
VLGQHLAGESEFYVDEHRVKTKSGDYIWILDTGRVVAHEAGTGKPARVTGIHQDITRRRMLEDTLREQKNHAEASDRAKSLFLAQMSHEIRTPMNGLSGSLLLLQDQKLDAESRELCEMMSDCSTHLLNVINDILDFSKLEQSKMQLEVIPTRTSSLFHTVQSIYGPTAQQRNIELCIDIDANVPNVVEVDPTRMRQVTYNLISNALKFTTKGHVTLRVSFTGDATLCIDVIDTGKGIAPDKIHTVFEKFTQEDNSISRKFGGTGLGLSIVQKLVTLMGGTVSITSEVDKGSTFSVRVPVKYERTDTSSPTVSPDLRQHGYSLSNLRDFKLSVLVAEDQKINYTILKRLLSKFGVTCAKWAQNGQELIDAVNEGIEHDFIITDWQMPTMNGFEAVQTLRNELSYDKPIVMLSANVLAEDRAKSHAIGVSAFIEKPVRLGQVIRVLDSVSKRLHSDSDSQ